MLIISSDSQQIVDVGTNDILNALSSTIQVWLWPYISDIEEALEFIIYGTSDANKTIEIAKQFVFIRDKLSLLGPECAVYDISNPTKPGPWNGYISKEVTSCANLFTTSDGKNLLDEIIRLCHYADQNSQSLVVVKE
ncbi:Imm70 family immunity protein [Proteiniclasticum sp. QWL-01]|uniref:Imm70 family immunity protein n=1 Tax=Proteiniclasticum sp. QWL-01 TaxID=3036945 RepID=UPI002410D3BA|nr:Imm70 family immunity protein [Proteiniclasticum sp. QWL-01]WFF73431.1 Imm70 family immunity protein [Proteiniclasticum sp. QWL-01]